MPHSIHFKHMIKACELFEVYYKGAIQSGYALLKSNPEYTIWFPKEAKYKKDCNSIFIFHDSIYMLFKSRKKLNLW